MKGRAKELGRLRVLRLRLGSVELSGLGMAMHVQLELEETVIGFFLD